MSPERRRAVAAALAAAGETVRTGNSVGTLERAFLDNLFYIQARFPEVASRNDIFMALAYTVRDRLLERWISTARTYKDQRSRTVCYLSAEYLLGPHLGNNLQYLGIAASVREAMRELGYDLDDLLDAEEEPGLGNGGLGRLAACYMDSMATLGIPAIGYGIRYEFGIFDQVIRDGCQVELADRWLRNGNPWEIPRPEITFLVRLGGHTEPYTDTDGRYRVRWVPARLVKGVAYDTPVLGYGVGNANLLRLFASEAPESFDFSAFNYGDYYRAVEDQTAAEALSKVLYPNDEPVAGKRLRLEQQYFFVSCALQDMIRIYGQSGQALDGFDGKYVVQLNDTHPAIAIAELMRLLVDEHGFDWDPAWAITTRTFAYTNHTLLPEALEKWPLALFEQVLPRHLQIIHEINQRFLDQARLHYLDDSERVRRLSIIDEDGPRYVRMANLACVGSFAINGVAELHSRLLREEVLRDFSDLWPQKFTNITNGVTPRRFLALANPALAALIDNAIGEGWLRDLERLRELEPLADDAGFRQRWREARLAAKQRLVQFCHANAGLALDPHSLFDVQVKRIHEYKRQHLNVLHVITLYNRLKHAPHDHLPARTVVFGGKAAPGYHMAKLIIRLINAVAAVVNNDPDIDGRLRVVFVPDLNVKCAERIYPAADLSVQISLAGKEASGTGNMKMAMNGALTIGTLDGANIEIRDAVGADNAFLFGLDAGEVAEVRARGHDPRRCYEADAELRAAIDLVASGFFAHGDRSVFQPLVDNLLHRDEYLVLADYRAYVDTQQRVGNAWNQPEDWTRMSVLNVARIGRFSSDRAIAEYARDIWRVAAVVMPEAGVGG